MAAYNGTRRKLIDGLVVYTNELSKKSFAGEPSTNFIETAKVDGDFDMLGGYDFYRIYKDINLFEEECATLPIEKNTKYKKLFCLINFKRK